MNWQSLDISISGLQKHYQNKDFTPTQLIEYLYTQIDKSDNPAWIYRLKSHELAAFIKELPSIPNASLPLYGVPFAIKDNIDLKDVPTTAGCPGFSYMPTTSAEVVKHLIAAGAIPLGKTNLDQFATGLVGVRSPYGVCKNVFNPNVISGGSSSGSAVAVANGWVSFSLGTDTAGSGRVPASLNHIVGLKPSRGLLSMSGVVPACRSLDSVSIFALNTDDANTVLDVAAQFDSSDAYSRQAPYRNKMRYYCEQADGLTFGVPSVSTLEFFGDSAAQSLFEQAVQSLTDQGIHCIEIDFSPFIKAAKLLYEGPWVTERYLATQSLIESQPEAMLPVIKKIIDGGKNLTAQAAFSAQYQLQEYALAAKQILNAVDVIITPTNGTTYTIAEVEADPITLNSNLGYYTNFMNLLDYSALAIPYKHLPNGAGFGVTVFSHAMEDKKLLSIGARLHNIWQQTMGAHWRHQVQGIKNTLVPYTHIDVVVCGAHLQGMPLNWQLTERGGVLVEATTTAPLYELFALPGGPPERPGLRRVREQGVSIDVEVWRLSVETFGSFVSEIPTPLGIGKIELASGQWVSGFICEPYALAHATNISELGGWRAYCQQQ